MDSKSVYNRFVVQYEEYKRSKHMYDTMWCNTQYAKDFEIVKIHRLETCMKTFEQFKLALEREVEQERLAELRLAKEKELDKLAKDMQDKLDENVSKYGSLF